MDLGYLNSVFVEAFLAHHMPLSSLVTCKIKSKLQYYNYYNNCYYNNNYTYIIYYYNNIIIQNILLYLVYVQSLLYSYNYLSNN